MTMRDRFIDVTTTLLDRDPRVSVVLADIGVARFRETFRPVRVGRFLVAPPWDRPSASSDDLLLVDPGRAFGTGTHETTRLCLREVGRRVRGGGRVLDVGCGSGVLSGGPLLPAYISKSIGTWTARVR